MFLVLTGHGVERGWRKETRCVIIKVDVLMLTSKRREVVGVEVGNVQTLINFQSKTHSGINLLMPYNNLTNS